MIAIPEGDSGEKEFCYTERERGNDKTNRKRYLNPPDLSNPFPDKISVSKLAKNRRYEALESSEEKAQILDEPTEREAKNHSVEPFKMFGEHLHP